MSTIYVVDIVLLVILYLLIMFMCGYGFFCAYRLIRHMQMRILLRPTRVVFSHRKEGDSTEELRSVVAYQDPFTGEYRVHKSRLGQGYTNALPPGGRGAGGRGAGGRGAGGRSPDSGLSDEYEPLHIEEGALPAGAGGEFMPEVHTVKPPHAPGLGDNSVNKTWNWDYKEYQI